MHSIFNRPPLPLCISGKKGDAFTIAGFQWFDQNFLIRPIPGHLGEEVGLECRDQAERIAAWDLKIDDADFDIQPGYSGSPVVSQSTGCVFGVVSYKLGTRKGLAVSVEAIKHIWQGMPENLFEETKKNEDRTGSPRNTFLHIQRKELEETLTDLCKKYQAAYADLRSETNSARKISLKNQINQIKQEIQGVENELKQL